MEKFKPGDKVRVACEATGVVVKDPTNSQFSILVQFNGEFARLPADGTLLGLKCLKLIRVKEPYEHP